MLDIQGNLVVSFDSNTLHQVVVRETLPFVAIILTNGSQINIPNEVAQIITDKMNKLTAEINSKTELNTMLSIDTQVKIVGGAQSVHDGHIYRITRVEAQPSGGYKYSVARVVNANILKKITGLQRTHLEVI